jgi:hypothetical protein
MPYTLKVPHDVWIWGCEQKRKASLEERARWDELGDLEGDDPANEVMEVPANVWHWAQERSGLIDPSPFLIDMLRAKMRGAKRLGSN